MCLSLSIGAIVEGLFDCSLFFVFSLLFPLQVSDGMRMGRMD